MILTIDSSAEDYYHTLLWMEEALKRAEEDESIAESEILEYLAFALYKQGNLKRALLSTDRLYEICEWCYPILYIKSTSATCEGSRGISHALNFRPATSTSQGEHQVV